VNIGSNLDACYVFELLDFSLLKPSAMVDLGGYVIIIVEAKDKKIKLYGT